MSGSPGSVDVCVVGAGLAGCLAAVKAARLGHKTSVYELRGDTRGGPEWQGRSINLAMSTRGLTALGSVGLEEKVKEMSVPMYGRMLHASDGATSEQAYGTSDAQHLLSVSRRQLNELLCDAAEAEPNVTLHFQHKLVSANMSGLEMAELTVQDVSAGGDGIPQTVPSSLVVGADGAWSKVRASMQRDVGTRLDFSQDYCPHSYKELRIPAGDGGTHRLPANYLHIWPRGEFMLIALPDLGGSFTCTLFIPHEALARERLDSAEPGQRERVAAFFEREFADVVPHMPTLLDDFVGNPTLPLVTIRCAPFHTDNGTAIVLGDAAHAIVPFYGQGCNAAFEDVRVLGELLEKHTAAPDFKALCSEFTVLRKRNADAIAELALEHYADMGVSTLSTLFLMRRAAENAVGRLLSGWYMSEYHMVSFSNIPYADARARAIANDGRINSLVSGAAVLAGGAALVLGATVVLKRQ